MTRRTRAWTAVNMIAVGWALCLNDSLFVVLLGFVLACGGALLLAALLST